MTLNNINGFSCIDDYVEDKINRYSKEEKNFKTLYSYMFSEKGNVLSEILEGYRIKKLTYGDCDKKIRTLSSSMSKALNDVPKNALVGLYMSNSVEWIQTFWSILMCGYRPLLLNARLPKTLLEQVIVDYDVKAVVSDSERFACPTIAVDEVYANDNGEVFEANDFGTEILFMSSGTTGGVKLCAYTGENFYYQICDSISIIKQCPQMREHYEGELKNLAVLPFYHVFGFIAIYIWFTFFSRTLVFLKDMNPQTLINTIKRHKVTHIFAVPLVWETVYKKAKAKIKERGEKTLKKFEHALNLSEKLGGLGGTFSKMAFKEVRDSLFGESVKFLISGGSALSNEALRFFNGIGYHMANGYGMTEIGIASVEISMKRSVRNKNSIGHPFENTEYSISDKGELLVRGKTMASRILRGDEVFITNFNEWFNTNDLARKEGDRFYLEGRKDDLLICENGENVNPELVERNLMCQGVKNLCLFAGNNGEPTLLISIERCYSVERLKAIQQEMQNRLKNEKLQDVVKTIRLTTDDLLSAGEFKISRHKVAEKYKTDFYQLIDAREINTYVQSALSQLETDVCRCIANVLEKSVNDVTLEADFFVDLGGTSLDYFVLLDKIKEEFHVEIALAKEEKLSTAKAFCNLIKAEAKNNK